MGDGCTVVLIVAGEHLRCRVTIERAIVLLVVNPLAVLATPLPRMHNTVYLTGVVKLVLQRRQRTLADRYVIVYARARSAPHMKLTRCSRRR